MTDTDDWEDLKQRMCVLVVCDAGCHLCAEKEGQVLFCSGCRTVTCQACVSTGFKRLPSRDSSVHFTCPRCFHTSVVPWRK